MFGLRGCSKTREGPEGVDDPEKMDERSGRMKRKRRGRRLEMALPRPGAGSEPGGCAVPGRLRGRPPPN